MKNIAKLLGKEENAEITLEDVEKFLEGKKLADLSSGDYVAKDKYEKLASQVKELETANTDLTNKVSDYDTIKKANEDYQAEKKLNFRKGVAKDLKVKDEFVDFVLSQVGDAEDSDYKSNFEEYIKSHPQYLGGTQVINSGADLGGKQPADDFEEFRKL